MLLTGYAKTGKDTFFQELQTKKLQFDELGKKEEAKWNVYAKKYIMSDILYMFETQPLKRFAFADILKDQTHHFLHISNVPTNAFEHVKDTCLFQDPNDPTQYKTIRGWYIHLGTEKRKQDPTFWANLLYKQLEGETANVITDWRMENEFRQGQLTMRLFRQDVPIPNFPSEHELDSWETDFLLVPPGDAKGAIKQFPQYKDYLLIGSYMA